MRSLPRHSPSTFVNSVSTTSGRPYSPCIVRHGASVTPSIGASPIIGCSNVSQKDPFLIVTTFSCGYLAKSDFYPSLALLSYTFQELWSIVLPRPATGGSKKSLP